VNRGKGASKRKREREKDFVRSGIFLYICSIHDMSALRETLRLELRAECAGGGRK